MDLRPQIDVSETDTDEDVDAYDADENGSTLPGQMDAPADHLTAKDVLTERLPKRQRTDGQALAGQSRDEDQLVRTTLDWIVTRVCHPIIKAEDGTRPEQTMDNPPDTIVISSDEDDQIL